MLGEPILGEPKPKLNNGKTLLKTVYLFYQRKSMSFFWFFPDWNGCLVRAVGHSFKNPAYKRQTWKKTIFCELWNFENAHLPEKRVNYDKFEIATNWVNQIFNLNAFFFLPFGRCYRILPYYLLSIYIFCNTDYVIQTMKMTFLKFFLFARSRIQIWRKNSQTW